ncbi:MAG: alpha/beta hydrolase [Myxococcales bacterium]|nr:alpha/beta hydrolase [Myxococcales bacterium]
MSSRYSGPASHTYVSQRLRLHYVDWGNEGAPHLLLVHGGRDHCRNWDWVAQALRDDYHIIAPDLRGHGDSQWMLGGNYSMVDYVYDIAQLIHQLDLAPLYVIGHSLGGHISLQYAGVYPDNVKRLISIEGFGPPPAMLTKRQETPPQQRMREWVEQLRGLSGRTPRRYASIEEAIARMESENPHLSNEQARHLTIHGASRNEDGTFSWKFDNYVRAGSPFFFHSEEMYELWSKISCPTLLIRGTKSWVGDPEKDGRIGHFQDARAVHIGPAGHWVHHDQLERFLEVARDFLKE